MIHETRLIRTLGGTCQLPGPALPRKSCLIHTGL